MLGCPCAYVRSCLHNKAQDYLLVPSVIMRKAGINILEEGLSCTVTEFATVSSPFQGGMQWNRLRRGGRSKRFEHFQAGIIRLHQQVLSPRTVSCAYRLPSCSPLARIPTAPSSSSHELPLQMPIAQTVW